jgi:hypothetical protein
MQSIYLHIKILRSSPPSPLIETSFITIFSRQYLSSDIPEVVMEAIAQLTRALFDKADEEGRRKIQEDLRALQSSLDTEWDAVFRLASGVNNPL